MDLWKIRKYRRYGFLEMICDLCLMMCSSREIRSVYTFVLVNLLFCVALGDSDPITKFQIDYPRDDGVVTLPLRFKFIIESSDPDAFRLRYGSMRVCVELREVTTKCSPVMGARIRFHELSESRYDAHAFILDEDGTRYHETATVSVSVVSAADFNEHVDKEIEQARVDQRFPLDVSLLQWAELLQLNSNTTVIRNSTMNAGSSSEEDGPLLVIGIKTAVLKNFARRQAIRETWANKAVLPPHVKVFFIGCIPNKENLRNVQRHETAIALERAAYGDLLTEELVQCEDSHFLLAEKVSSFLEWVHADLPQTKYVMIADDDIYTKVNGVVKDLQSVVQREKLYLGELPNPVHHRPLGPIRDPSSLYYTSKHSYPMEQFIPYAAGPHFILSMDCVRFIARNRRRLRSLSGQDDTSVALWLLIIQVHVQQTPALVSLRFFPCKNDVLSLADLSPLGIRSIHANVLHNRPFCFGFDRTTWEWRPIE